MTRRAKFHPIDLRPSMLVLSDDVALESDGAGAVRPRSWGSSGSVSFDTIASASNERPQWTRVDGYRTLRFDGSNDRLWATSIGGLPSGGDDCTAITVAANPDPAPAASQFLLFWYTFPDGKGINLLQNDFRVYIDGYHDSGLTLWATPELAVVGFDYSAADQRIRTFKNDSAGATFTGVVDTTGAGATDEISIGGYSGGGLAWAGDIRMLALWDRVLTDAERARCVQWARDNLGVA